MATPEMKAAKQARQIERHGNTVTLADGVTTIKAIPDTNPETTRAGASQSILDDAGRATLVNFHLTPKDYKTYMLDEGQTLKWQGTLWTPAGPAKPEVYSDVPLFYVLLAYAGGNPA